MKIDLWTLSLQAINVLILLWLLRHFLFKPIQQVLTQRQDNAARLSAQTQAALAAAEQERKQLAAERAGLAQTREQTLAEARVSAQHERQALLDAAAAAAAQLTAASRKALAGERAEAAQTLQQDLAGLAVDIARQLLQRLPRADVEQAFIDGACAQLAALTPEQRASLGADGDSALEAEIISDTALDAAAQQHCRERLQTLLGRAVTARFLVDPSLLAGIELRFRHHLIRNSWAADLERIRATLNQSQAAATASPP